MGGKVKFETSQPFSQEDACKISGRQGFSYKILGRVEEKECRGQTEGLGRGSAEVNHGICRQAFLPLELRLQGEHHHALSDGSRFKNIGTE